MRHPSIIKDWEAAAANYKPADTSPRAEWESFVSQLGDAANRRKGVREPTEDEKLAVRSVLEHMYRAVYDPIPKDWSSYDHFVECLAGLDNASSPGYPYMLEASTIGQWLKADGLGGYDPSQVQRLWFDVQQVMAGTYEHIHRAFVKDEPHKIKKVQEKRWRLIIAGSLPVQMAWRMVFGHQNARLNAMPYEIPSKHGLVFCYGGWRRFLSMVRSQELFISRDISAWDVNAPGWVFEVVGAWRADWPGVGPEWRRVQQLLYEDAYARSRILFSNGVVVQQQFRGFMKSGCFNTIADNSLAMVAMHILACLRSGTCLGNIAATGDDVMQSVITDGYVRELEALGCRVKEVIRHVEFMGTDYRKGVPEPMYFQKHLVNVCMKPDNLPAVLDSYCRLYAYSDKQQFWMDVARELGVATRTSSYYRFWYSSPLARVMNSLW
nr:RNA-dependent RNA polymerase [Virus sp.]